MRGRAPSAGGMCFFIQLVLSRVCSSCLARSFQGSQLRSCLAHFRARFFCTSTSGEADPMKSFFASKRYDLCAAQRVHSWNNGREVTDSAYRAISLYHTPEGG